MPTPTTWDRVLQAVLLALTAYGVTLVVASGVVERLLFGPLGFGFAAGDLRSVQAQAYGRFTYGVLGAVLAGWAVTLLGLARGPLARRDPGTWRWVVAVVGLWFVLDTGLSLAVGQLGHAAFNVGFAVLLGLPLAAIRPRQLG